MSLANLATSTDVEAEVDSVGNSGPVESGVYGAKILMAYFSKSKGGAMSLVLNLGLSMDGRVRELRQTLWITSGDAKGNKNYYERDGVKNYLPGFNVANSLCELITGVEIAAVTTEEKVVGVYDFGTKAEVPTKVDVLMPLLNQDIAVGVIHQTVDKNVKDANGAYVPSGETRDENEVDKFFRASDGLTLTELKANATEPAFLDKWKAKWDGVIRNKAKGATAAGGTPNSGAFGNTDKPTTSLFTS